jgi:TonB family protein
MPPTAKELDVITSPPETSGARPADTPGRPQPVALEVPVSVNGARTVAGSDKREPFSESTMTVLVFGNGAVIRLASTVVPGQLLFLTNDKTKKEVVCQVVKSKNYSNVSGYVELEFTEAVTGFWGMRFPGERGLAQSSAPTPAATATPIAPPAAAPKIPSPAVTSAPKPVASKPAPPPVVMRPAGTSTTQANAQVNLPRAAETKPVTALPKPTAPLSPLGTTTTTSLLRASEVKPAAPVVTKAPPPPAPTASQSSTDALKRESARLQEQLSSLLFTPEAPAKPAPPAHTKTVPPAKNAPLKMESTLDVEEVKIPSWLEPLARNAATTTPGAAAEDEPLPIDVDKAQEFELEDLTAASIAQQTGTTGPAESTLASPLVNDEMIEPWPVSAGSNKGMLIGVTAGLLVLAAGGAWVLRKPSNPAVQGPVTAATTPAVGVNSAVQPQPQPQRSAAVQTAPAASLAPATSQAAAPSHVSAQPAAASAQPVKTTSNTNTPEALSAYKQLAEPEPQSKKPGLGKVHLATPTAVSGGGSSRGVADAEPAFALNEGQVSPSGDALGGGFGGGNTKQPVAPAAPLPVGGDVKAAHMLSSVSPVYPTLAKNQHIEGDVRIDALIGANGHVSGMKVVSGPTLLHQAAMDALRQWKYQPAVLDGNPVPMHLTVTIQFRLQ